MATATLKETEVRRALATMSQACAMLAASRPTIYKLIENGALKPVRLPGTKCLRFKWSDLEALVDSE